ncbi:MAG: hypothetical protein CMJ89_05005 [Planctomycetes bacterium]|nr:hypothetical protein [Planctomycetota bacterium]
MSGLSLSISIGASLALLTACGDDAARSRWIALDAEAPALEIRPDEWNAWAATFGCVVRVDEHAAAPPITFEWTLEGSDWEQAGTGIWSVPLPEVPGFSGARGGIRELGFGEASFPYEAIEFAKDLTGGCFGTIGKDLLLKLDPEDSVPSQLSYTEFIPRGNRNTGVWRTSVGNVTGAGLPVWPGERWSIQTPIPSESALRFYLAARGTEEGVTTGGEIQAAIHLNGEEIWRHVRKDGRRADAWHTVSLPGAGGDSNTLEFTIAGARTLTAFFDPAIGPGEPERLDDSRRPNVILFLADTFRADNLSAYGGAPDVTPFLNRLAEASVLFERSWSTSSWTLPAQASLFSSLQPPQHGAELDWLVLSRSLTTLAEVLHRNGYRTGAVTDSNFISAKFNFDQGFQWFHETDKSEGWSLNETLKNADAFLGSGDGRPTFLFVHTYRTHEPYRVGEEESPKEARRYLVDVFKQAKEGATVDRFEVAAGLIELYRKGASDLDRKLERWVERLRRDPEWNRTYFVFTSDHGEAFYEHKRVGHRGPLWEETLRIPLFIHGHGLPPARRAGAASLVDLAPTIAALTGVGIPPPWQGSNLLTRAGDRPIYGFCGDPKALEVAIIEGDHKVRAPYAALEEFRVHGAYDLSTDPMEKANLAGQQGWPSDLLPTHYSHIAELLRAIVPAESLPESAMDDKSLRILRELGYAGD